MSDTYTARNEPFSIRDALSWEDACHIMRAIKSYCGSYNAHDAVQRSALHWAVVANKLWIVHAVLQFPMDVDARDVNGETPLLMACKNRAFKVVLLLAGAGADPEIYENRRDSPLLWAAYHGCLDITRFLVEELKVDLEHTYVDYRNALLWAASRSNWNVVKYLYPLTESRNAVDREGCTLSTILGNKNPRLLNELREEEILLLCRYYATKERPPRHPLLEVRTLGLITALLSD
jgi:ankyrin repeat protein